MLTTTLRAMWKDWGFAPSVFGQARQFLDLAKQSATQAQEGYIRASLVFSVMAFEAYWVEVIRGCIQEKKSSVSDPAKLQKIEEKLTGRKKASIAECLKAEF